jgi:hypothetical protein
MMARSGAIDHATAVHRIYVHVHVITSHARMRRTTPAALWGIARGRCVIDLRAFN